MTAKLGDEQKNASDKDLPTPWIVFSRFFEAACEKATSKELDQVIDIYVRLPQGANAKTFPFPTLAAAWIAREIAPLDLKVTIPQEDISPNPSIQDASPELISAWKLYKNATRKADKLLQREPDARTISFQTNEAAFHRLIDDVLLKRGDKLVERLAEFTWGGWCGTGAGSLGEPQSIGEFMALLQERRLDEAVGAAIRMATERPVRVGDKNPSARIQFLKKCGLDWEAILAGSLLKVDDSEFPGLWYTPSLTELAAYGSERSLAFISELALRANPRERREYTYALMAFLPPDPDKLVWSSGDIIRPVAITIPTEAKARIVSLLRTFAESNPDRDIAEAIVAALARANSPETKPALRVLLNNPSERVAEDAAKALRKLGEDVPPPARRPVRFRILANGKPLPSGTSVNWGLFAGTCLLSAFADVDSTGILNLARENFVNRRDAITIELRNGEFRDVKALTFSVQLPIPQNLDELTDVNVDVVAMRLQIEPSRKQSPEQSEARVRIQKHNKPDSEEGEAYWDLPMNEFQAPLAEPVVFSIQKGTYNLEVLASGSARHRSLFDAVMPEGAIHVSLAPGADLRFEPIRPDGERETSWILLQGGKEVPDYRVILDEDKPYRGLPIGYYVLHINSSVEEAARRGDDFAPLQPYAGKDIPFRITADTPVIDLGEIRLDPVK